MPFRIDIGALKSAKRLPDGRVLVEGHLTRTGVFTYRNPDGTERRELRLPEEVFKQDSMDTFGMAPVTNNHPPELITAKNAKQYAVGAVGENVMRDDDHVRAKLTVYDADTIAQMDRGKVQLSCGYECDLEETPGEHPQYGRYDAVQRNIRGNHVAIVEAGRAGDSARVRMDAAVQQPVRDNMSNETVNQDAIKATLEKLAAVERRADAAEASSKKFETEAAEAKGQIETLKETVASLQQARKDADEAQGQLAALRNKLQVAETALIEAQDVKRFDDAVRARAKLERSAAAVLGARVTFDTLSNREVMTLALERLGVHVADLKDEKEAYIKGRFDTAVDRFFEGEKAYDGLRASTVTTTASSEVRIDTRSAREIMIARNRNLEQEQK